MTCRSGAPGRTSPSPPRQAPEPPIFRDLAGTTRADWIFMIGLLGMMYLASLPLETNPFLDEHITEALMIVCQADLRPPSGSLRTTVAR